MTTPHIATRGRRTRRPVWSWMLPAAMLLIAAGIPLLVLYAGDAIFNSADGEFAELVTDPAAPGYEVIVVASPSQMVFSLDPAGELVMVSLLSLGHDDVGGTVLHLPAEATLTNNNQRRLSDVWRERGERATRRRASEVFGVGVDQVVVLDETSWAQLVLPAGAIPVDLDEDLVEVTDDGTRARFFAGNATVTASEVSEFLGWVNPGEHPAARLQRHDAFWEAWLASISASADPGIVPGEVDTGIGRFLRGLAVGPTVVTEADVEPIALESGLPAVAVDPVALQNIVSQMIPFPLPAEPGARPRVRVLDGVGGLDLAADYSPSLVRAGAQIVILGNASSFGLPTAVVYHDQAWAEAATAFADAIGGADVTFEPVQDVVLDVTVIIGEDLGVALGD